MARAPKTLHQLLYRPHSQLSRIVDRVHQQRSLLRHIHDQLPSDLSPHCLHAEIDHGELMLFFDNSAWAHRAQFLGPELLANMTQTGLPDLKRLRVRVLPKSGTSSRERRRTITLSDKNAEIIEAAAEGISDVSLRASLLKLAKRRHSRGE